MDLEFKKILPLYDTKKTGIDSLYKKGYTISKSELEYVTIRVNKLKEQTEKACKERINSFVIKDFE